MTTVIENGLRACDDCIQAIANDDYSSMNDETEVSVRAGLARLSKRGYAVVGDDLGFCWQGCDCCGSKLGGNKHEVSLLAVCAELTTNPPRSGVQSTDGCGAEIRRMTYIDSAYGSLFQKRGRHWYIRPSFRHPGFEPGKGADGAKFGDWQKLGETLGPDRALASGRLVPYDVESNNG